MTADDMEDGNCLRGAMIAFLIEVIAVEIVWIVYLIVRTK
jgi:hypothetical protein